MKTRLIAVGNSKAVRIPKAMLIARGMGDAVEVVVVGSQIVIRNAVRRGGWRAAARLMHQRGDDVMLDAPLPSLTKFDEEEWEW